MNVNIKTHSIIDRWRVEIDGKTYWVERNHRADDPVDRDNDWQVESVRPTPGYAPESEWFQIVDHGGRTWKRVVAAMRASIAAGLVRGDMNLESVR